MSRSGLILLGLGLWAATAAAQDLPTSEAPGTARPFTPAQERAAAEARARQARIRSRHTAGVSLGRPSFRLTDFPLNDPRLPPFDHGIKPGPGYTPRSR